MIYRQGDPGWGHVTLGYGPATIGEAGCLLTTFAQVLSHYGFSVNPLGLNEVLKQTGRWINGDLLGDASISNLPQFAGVQFVTKWDFTHRPADLSVLTNNQQDEYVIELDFDHRPDDGIQTHFVRFVSWDGQHLIIDDPEFGSEGDFTKHYGTDLATTILKIVKYNGPAAQTAPPPPVPPVPAPFGGNFTPLTGTAHVNAPANVRTGPGTNYPLNTTHTPGGKLAVGIDFPVSGEAVGDDPYGDGRNKWVRSQYGNYIWEGNVTVHPEGGKGGETVKVAVKSADLPVAPDTNQTPAIPAAETKPEPTEPELKHLGYQAWLKPALNDETRTHEGAPVIDLATGQPAEVFEMGAKAPFTAYKVVDGVNYFVSQHMLDNNLNYGINGLNLQEATQPDQVMSPEQATTTTPEQAAAQPDVTVEDFSEHLGKIFSPLVKFIEKHHPNNKKES